MLLPTLDYEKCSTKKTTVDKNEKKILIHVKLNNDIATRYQIDSSLSGSSSARTFSLKLSDFMRVGKVTLTKLIQQRKQ